jgi:hypothetical protein
MFQTVTLLGFSLRRFPLPRHGLSLSAYPARLALARTDPPTRAERILACLPGVALRGSPLSSASRRSGRTRASLGLRAPSRGTLPPRRPRSRRGPPPTGLVGFDASTGPEPASRSVDRGRPRDSPKRTSPPPGVSAPRPGEPGVGAEQVSTPTSQQNFAYGAVTLCGQSFQYCSTILLIGNSSALRPNRPYNPSVQALLN